MLSITPGILEDELTKHEIQRLLESDDDRLHEALFAVVRWQALGTEHAEGAERILNAVLRALRSIDVQEIRRALSYDLAQRISKEELRRGEWPPHPLDDLRRLLETHFPKLYTLILEPTLADLRKEHSAALAEGQPLKARWILLQGCGALVAGAVCQLGYSLLGRIAALWQARSPK